ncbi:uncharacterized protein crybg2 [Pholidichthys leucotaenia]
MAKKGGPRRTLKGLFSKSELNLDESVVKDVDKSEGEKKKFKLFKFMSKSKNDSGSEKSAGETQQVPRDAEPSNTAVDGEPWADDVAPDNKRSTLYGTAPRAKAKELSYSEMDLRKPKKFATISFSLGKKKKKKEQENNSENTSGLPTQYNEEQEEIPMEVDPESAKSMSMSQPELDSCQTFDIPTPPPVATNQSELYLTVNDQPQSSYTQQMAVAKPDTTGVLVNGSGHLDVEGETPKAPLASIAELQLTDSSSSDEKESITVHENTSKIYTEAPAGTTSEAISVVHTQNSPNLSPIVFDTDHKAAPADSASTSTNMFDSDRKPKSTSVMSSPHHPSAPDTANYAVSNSEFSLVSADSKNDSAVLLPHNDKSTTDADPATVHHAVLVTHTERSVPESAKSTDTPTTAVGEKTKAPGSPEVYEALYGSLFPQSFTSEVITSLLKASPQTHTELRHFSTKSEAVVVKTLSECHTETNIPTSHVGTSLEFDPASYKVNDTVDGSVSTGDLSNPTSSSETSGLPFYQTSTASQHQSILEIHYKYLPSSRNLDSKPVSSDYSPYSEPTSSLSQVKSDSTSLTADIVRSVPVSQDSAPPVSDYLTSQGTDTQVTDFKQQVILVKESVIDEASTVPGSSYVSRKMSSSKGLVVMKIDAAEVFSEPSRQVDESSGPLSPAYLSMGSDDGSAVEIYYSAEEDNGEENGNEELFTIDEREKRIVELHEEAPEKGVIGQGEGDSRVIIVKMESSEENGGDWNLLMDQKSEVHGVGTSETEKAVTSWPEMTKEELPAPPVQQVSTLMVCDFAPPSGDRHGRVEGLEGNSAMDLESEAPSTGGTELQSQESQTVSVSEIGSSEYMHTKKEDLTAPALREGEEQLPQSAQFRESTSVVTDSTLTDNSGAAEVVAVGSVTHSTQLQSDATEIEDNRAPQSSEWVDTITHSSDRNASVVEQVAVELLAPSADARRLITEAAESHLESQEHPAEGPPHLHVGSVASSEDSHQTNADQDSVNTMNSGYSSLSTKLSIKTSPLPRVDESKHRVYKVSLIKEANPATVGQDTVDFNTAGTTVLESNGTFPDSEYKWENRFEAVTQYKPEKSENSTFSDSLSHNLSDSSSTNYSSSLLPEDTAYKHLSDASSSSYSSYSSSSTFPEEHTTFGDRLSDRTVIYLSRESEGVRELKDEWRRSFLEPQEEPAAPASERLAEGEGEPERLKSLWDSQQLPASGLHTSYDDTDGLKEVDEDSSPFTGVFTATRVELIPDPSATPPSPPASPDDDSPSQFDMEMLVDTLKSMGPSFRQRAPTPRVPAPVLISSLPPIVEDTPLQVPLDEPDSIGSPKTKMEAAGAPPKPPNGLYILPSDLGLKRNSQRDNRSPFELLKQAQEEQQQPGTKGLNMAVRTSTLNSIVMRKPTDFSSEDSQPPGLNGNELLSPSATSSRLDSSILFGSYKLSTRDQTEENQKPHQRVFRASSLPDIRPSKERLSVGLKNLGEPGAGADPSLSRLERLFFLMNSSMSSSGSLTGAEDSNPRMSWPPSLSQGSPPSSISSPTHLLSLTGSVEPLKPFAPTDSSLSMFTQTGMDAGKPILQRSLSSDAAVGVQTSLFSNVHGESQFQSQAQEPERNLLSKYRAFPDAYLTKEKEHGKLNPRPGKMYIFERPGMCGKRIEVRGDVIDATPWELQETISIRVVRGGWVLYEKPNYKGEKIALDEGDIEISYPFNLPEEEEQQQQQNDKMEAEEQNGETSEEPTEAKPPRRFIIGSLRRAVRDYSVPEICLFPEENAEGKKVIFRDTSEDARIFGFPVKANSIIINAGLWLVYAQPFFQGVPRILEVGGYSNPAAWGVEQPYVASLHPLKVGEPRVENLSEPKMVIYDKPYFSGKSRTITTNMRDFMTRMDRQQTAFMYSVGSLKVVGGIWVGYEKEGFRGHQYLLEEGDYHDWRVWGGNNSELRSVRVIRADLSDPQMVMFEQPEENQEGMQENTFEVVEATPDVELFGFKTSTRSIHVLSGAWIAYSHVDFSGNQYILEKGYYSNCADWGSEDNRICSVQPILLVPSHNSVTKSEILLYSEPDFQGGCYVVDKNQEVLPEKHLTKSCRVAGGSWVLYEGKQYSGDMYVLSEGDYPNLYSIGCPPSTTIRSIKVVPMMFSVPSISLFGLECLEGREITTETEIISMIEEGFNDHILSVRVNSGCWVICEHSNYRGRQFLLEPIEITNWPKFSSVHTVGSMYPVRQKRHFFRIKNKERGHFLSVQGGVEEMKSGRVVVTPELEPLSDIWFYQDGLIKSKLAPVMSLQVVGNVEPGSKVVLWSETRQPIQTWTAQMSGLIASFTFSGMVLDVKGGKTYDKDHAVLMPETEERLSQQWEIELL